MSITATLVPVGAGAAAAGAAAAGRAAAPGAAPGCWARPVDITKQTESGPAAIAAQSRESLTLSTPCLIAGHPDRGGLCGKWPPLAGCGKHGYFGPAEGGVLCRVTQVG